MEKMFLVFLGSGLGGGARYLLATWLPKVWAGAFPLATLIVNASGSFLLAAIIELALSTSWVGPNTRLFLATGVMGGFTTYSTFNYETLHAFHEGARGLAALYLLGTVVGCLAAGALGMGVVRFTLGR